MNFAAYQSFWRLGTLLDMGIRTSNPSGILTTVVTRYACRIFIFRAMVWRSFCFCLKQQARVTRRGRAYCKNRILQPTSNGLLDRYRRDEKGTERTKPSALYNKFPHSALSEISLDNSSLSWHVSISVYSIVLNINRCNTWIANSLNLNGPHWVFNASVLSDSGLKPSVIS